MNEKNITIPEKNDAAYQCLSNGCDVDGFILAPLSLRKNPPLCPHCGEAIVFNFMWEKTMIKENVQFVIKNNMLVKTKSRLF